MAVSLKGLVSCLAVILVISLGVQNLIKKQEAVDAEITAHEQLLNAVISTTDQLIERQHYASDEIEVRCAELQETWDELTSLSATRHQKLQESLQGQQVRTYVVISRVFWCYSMCFTSW